ncbi:MAG: hypothetical protein AAF591_00540 [Verrucomicrobiota bacterium]
MSDHVEVVFHDPNTFNISPRVSLQYHATSLIRLLEGALPRMRTGDVEYSCARFIGHCHEKTPGANGIGVISWFLETSWADGGEALYNDMLGAAPPEIALVDARNWRVTWNGKTIELPAGLSADESGLKRQ